MNVYVNGAYRNRDEVKELFEPGFLFGWGVFETLRVYQRKPAFLTDHLARLKKGAQTIYLEYPAIDFAAVIQELLKANDLEDAYLRISLFKQRENTGVLVYVDKFAYYPEKDYEKGYSLVVFPYRRHSKSIYSTVKSISYLESRLAWHYAQQQKKDEGLFLSTDEFVQEGSRSNVFFIKKNEIFTPALSCGILDGITRRQAMAVIKDTGFSCKEGTFTLQQLMSADEVFITSSLMEIMAIREVEKAPIGKGSAGPITLRLLAEYRKRIR